MKRLSLKRLLVLGIALSCLLGFLAISTWQQQADLPTQASSPVHETAPLTDASTPTPPESEPAAQATQTVAKPTKPMQVTSTSMAPPAKVVSAQKWQVNVSGQPIQINVALDEAVLRDAKGRDSIIKLDPAATWETLPARLATLSSARGVFPVAYPAHVERSDATRLFVTPDLRVQMDGTQTEQIAAKHQLTIKSRPTYAPGWVIMTAKTPLTALDVVAALRAETPAVTAADVLLGSRVQKTAAPNDPLFPKQWHLAPTALPGIVPGIHINASPTWNYPAATGIRGNGIRIGIVDDGLETTHPDLAANVDIANGYDWNGADTDPTPDPDADDFHGTACAGVAAARGNNDIGGVGSAPEATLIGMRLISNSGFRGDEQDAEAMAYLPNLIEIKSNSWGPAFFINFREAPEPLTAAAFQTVTQTGRNGKGSILLFAMGNSNSINGNNNGYANSIYTIGVGAIADDGKKSYYSQLGSCVVISAPSSGGSYGITTTDLVGPAGYDSNENEDLDYTDTFGGTSSATPAVAGVCALMLQKNPALGWRDVKEILIRSATRLDPTSTAWTTNAAGLAFSHDLGSGLVNATAAVDLAGTWTNLPTMTSVASTQSELTVPIPDSQPQGIVRTFDLSASSLRVEHVTLKLSALHSSMGNLAVTLTSPSGMTSQLAVPDEYDESNNLYGWTFSSVRHWGENSSGTWTVRIADLSPSGNTTGGLLTAAELTVYGSQSTLLNPAPIVRITSPSPSQEISPGQAVTVAVEASTPEGCTSPITQVELLENGVLIGTDTSAPFSFTYTPAAGNRTLIARATNGAGSVGSSASVTYRVTNLAPIITAAALSATGQSNANVPLTVASITASDPEGSPILYRYQWQSCTSGTPFTNIASATTATAPILPGKLLRCLITPRDSQRSGLPFTTTAVNVLPVPLTSATPGNAYTYTSGLVIQPTFISTPVSAIINEISQGSTSEGAEWVELLTLQSLTLRGLGLNTNFQSTGTGFQSEESLSFNSELQVPAGTLLVIYNGDSADPLLPPEDLDPSDGNMFINSNNADYFYPEGNGDLSSWFSLPDSGQNLSVVSGFDALHSIGYGSASVPADATNLGALGIGRSAHFNGLNPNLAYQSDQWSSTTSLVTRDTADTGNTGGVTPGLANTAANAQLITTLRNGGYSPVRFRLTASSILPSGLALDPLTGKISDTISPSSPLGNYPITLELFNTLGEVVSQSYSLQLTNNQSFAAWIATYPAISPSPTSDPDNDGIPSLVENLLGTLPDRPNPGLAVLTPSSQSTATKVFRHTRSNNPAIDITSNYEWSTDLTIWKLSGGSLGSDTLTLTSEIITDTTHPDLDLIEVTAKTSGTVLPKQLFLRLKATR